MKFRAEIDVMPLPALLDPQGKAVHHNMHNVGVQGIEDVRIGKHITLDIEAASEAEARQKTEVACAKILANPVMEHYRFELAPLTDS